MVFWLTAGAGTSLFTSISRPTPKSFLTPIQWLPGTLFLGCEGDHSLSSSVKFMSAWSYTSALAYIIMVWYVIKYRDYFTFTLSSYNDSSLINIVVEWLELPFHIWDILGSILSMQMWDLPIEVWRFHVVTFSRVLFFFNLKSSWELLWWTDEQSSSAIKLLKFSSRASAPSLQCKQLAIENFALFFLYMSSVGVF